VVLAGKTSELGGTAALAVDTGAIVGERVGIQFHGGVRGDGSAAQNLRTGIEDNPLVRESVSGEQPARAVVPVHSIASIAIAIDHANCRVRGFVERFLDPEYGVGVGVAFGIEGLSRR